ncbi:MAG: hypothetical protein S4CHLAM7_04780 [Chlamydiae bacterium]|nr:hypothetical protein [Chlamydiota bacterium]
MKILLTGASGYIGARLLIRLIQENHFVYVLVRNPSRFNPPPNSDGKIKVIEGDILDMLSLKNIPSDIEVAYYLIHSMSKDAENFDLKDRIAAENFIEVIQKTACKQIVYLSGIVNDDHLSKHLSSRFEVEKILKTSTIPVTCLRAAIIIGAGSASFEIIRDLVEKLPIMIAPKWVLSKCQPISIVDVIDYLSKVLNHKDCIGQSFDIGGEEALTYREILLRFAKLRKLRRYILVVPFFTPRLSSYWLFFITTVNIQLAKALVDSLKNNAVCSDQKILKILPKKCLTFEESVKRAFQKIEDHEVISSWKDAWSGGNLPAHFMDYIQVPNHGCLTYTEIQPFSKTIDSNALMQSMYQVGGKNGYYVNWAWKIRGLIDRLLGGVGLRRGKVSREKPRPGDALDFWRVLVVDEQKHRFLLYAEMKLPGEAWLEFNIEAKGNLVVKATFRPSGIFGRLYWYVLWPIHLIIFRGLALKIIKRTQTPPKEQDHTS